VATKVQRKVLWWMIDNGGELYITSGNKRVLFAHTDAFGKPGEIFCKGNENLTRGLEAQGYAIRMFKYGPEHTQIAHDVNGVVTYEPRVIPTKEQETLRHRFKITEAGILAAGSVRPDPEEHSNVPHRNHRYKRPIRSEE
jgi:hypothetical protein